MIDGLDIRQGLFGSDFEFQQLVDLQNEVYKERGITFSINEFKRWYVENPFGHAISFNAFDRDIMAAHYVCIPMKMVVDGRLVNGIKSMATVTHPKYRGRGLFKTLAKMTYDCAKEQGFEFVIGVANDNSFPGFMKYFPFTFVSQLEVKIGTGMHIEQDREKMFSPFWNTEALNWRLKCGGGVYSRKNNSIIGKYNSCVQTFMGSFPDDILSSSMITDKGWINKPKLYVGLGSKIQSPYFNVPKFIKHSPFNLIFLDLTRGKLPQMTKDNVFFQLIDFDVA